MARASKLFYMAGITRDAGDYFDGIPRRDLDGDEVARFSDEVYAHITGTPPFAEGSPYAGPLYSATKPGATKDEIPIGERDAAAIKRAKE